MIMGSFLFHYRFRFNGTAHWFGAFHSNIIIWCGVFDVNIWMEYIFVYKLQIHNLYFMFNHFTTECLSKIKASDDQNAIPSSIKIIQDYCNRNTNYFLFCHSTFREHSMRTTWKKKKLTKWSENESKSRINSYSVSKNSSISLMRNEKAITRKLWTVGKMFWNGNVC